MGDTKNPLLKVVGHLDRDRPLPLLVGLTLGLATVLLLASFRETEPEANGKKLSFWLNEMVHEREGGSGFKVDRFGGGEATRSALQTIGTNAIPFLLKRLRSKDLPINRLKGYLVRKGIWNIGYTSARTRRLKAVWALWSLRPASEGAIPELSRLSLKPDYTEEATLALCGLGSNSLPPLLHALTNGDARVRAAAAGGLGTGFRAIQDMEPCSNGFRRIGATNEPSISRQLGTEAQANKASAALILRLGDPEPNVRASAAWALGNIGLEPRTVLLPLIQRLQDTNSYCSAMVRESLCQPQWIAKDLRLAIEGLLTSPDISTRLETIQAIANGAFPDFRENLILPLIQALVDSDPRCRSLAASALGSFGSKANSAIPALRGALRDRDESVRKTAAEALTKIDQEKQPEASQTRAQPPTTD